MTEAEFQSLKNKIENEWSIRCKLATLAGFPANPNNPRALVNSDFDLNIRELYQEILFRNPSNLGEALNLIQGFYLQ